MADPEIADIPPAVQSPVSPLCALLSQIGRGDRNALRSLYAKVGGKLFSMSLAGAPTKEFAEDILVDIFVDIWREAKLVDWNAKDIDPYLWLYVRFRSVLQSRHFSK